jgi:hypothetical protein
VTAVVASFSNHIAWMTTFSRASKDRASLPKTSNHLIASIASSSPQECLCSKGPNTMTDSQPKQTTDPFIDAHNAIAAIVTLYAAIVRSYDRLSSQNAVLQQLVRNTKQSSEREAACLDLLESWRDLPDSVKDSVGASFRDAIVRLVDLQAFGDPRP